MKNQTFGAMPEGVRTFLSERTAEQRLQIQTTMCNVSIDAVGNKKVVNILALVLISLNLSF